MATNAVSNNALSNMSGLSEAELQKRAQSLVDVKTGKISALSALDAALADANAINAGQVAMQNFTAAGSASIDVHAIDDPLTAFNNAKALDGFASEPPAPPQIGGPQAQLEKASKSGAKKMTGFCGSYSPPPPPPPAAPPPPPAVVSPEKPSPVGAAPPAAPTSPAAPSSPARDQPTAPSTGGRATPQGRRSGFLDGSAGNPTTPNNAAATPAPSASGPSSADVSGAQSDLQSNSSDMQFEILKMKINRMSQIQDMMSNVVGAMSDEAMGAIRNVKAS